MKVPTRTSSLDPFGNLTTKQVTAGSGPSLSVSVNPGNNQIQGLGNGYDANGNSYINGAAYDAENRAYAVGVGGLSYNLYSYDAQGNRIFLSAAATDSYGNPTTYSVVLYSPSGQKLAMYQINTCSNSNTSQVSLTICSLLQTSDRYFGGRRLAVLDQLGSAGTYYPWGEAKGTTYPQDTWSYATYWRDSSTGLDYANNRYYSNAYGRFMTVDPSMKSADPRTPSSWNRYPYVLGDPVNSNDPTGLDNDDWGVCDVDPFLAECGLLDPYGGTALPPAPASSYPPAPTSLNIPLTGASGTVGYLSFVAGTGTANFQFGNIVLTVPFSALQSLPAAPAGGYWAYVSCFLTGIAGSVINNPEVPGVSVWAMVQGLLTGAAWGPGIAVAGGVTITVDMFNIENKVATACAKQTGYTPWILQN